VRQSRETKLESDATVLLLGPDLSFETSGRESDASTKSILQPFISATLSRLTGESKYRYIDDSASERAQKGYFRVL
jgi:hypothetical protein